MCGPLPPLQFNVTWRLDVTEELMRMNGQDPYRHRKAKFLVATRDVRTQMAAKTHAESIQHAVVELPSQLLSIACDERLSMRDRRAVLDALRVELDTGVKGGRVAAERIDTFIATTFGRPEACGQLSAPAAP